MFARRYPVTQLCCRTCGSRCVDQTFALTNTTRRSSGLAFTSVFHGSGYPLDACRGHATYASALSRMSFTASVHVVRRTHMPGHTQHRNPVTPSLPLSSPMCTPSMYAVPILFQGKSQGEVQVQSVLPHNQLRQHMSYQGVQRTRFATRTCTYVFM